LRIAWGGGAATCLVGSQWLAFSLGGFVARILVVLAGVVAAGLLLQYLLSPRATHIGAFVGLALLGPGAVAIDSSTGSVVGLGLVGVLVFLAGEAASMCARLEVIDDPSPVAVQGQVQDAATLALGSGAVIVGLSIIGGVAVPGGAILVLLAAGVVAALTARLR
jgi:hypothetical protein